MDKENVYYAIRHKKNKRYSSARSYGGWVRELQFAAMYATPEAAVVSFVHNEKSIANIEVVSVKTAINPIDVTEQLEKIKKERIRQIKKKHAESLRRELAKYK